MRSDIFYWLLNMSLSGGAVLLIVLLLRRLRVLPRGFVFALWSLPFLRLTLPVGLRSPWSLMALFTRLGARQVELGAFSVVNNVQFAESYFPVTYRSNALAVLFAVAAPVWAVIAAAGLITTAVLYGFTRTELRGAQRADGFFRSTQVDAPALYGVIRPKIVVPEGLGDDVLPYVLLHERAHARRLDNLWRCLAILTCCVHWFNPLCWFSLRYFFADMELACDASVLRRLDGAGRRAYAGALLQSARQRSVLVSAFGGAKIRVRIETILSYRRLTAASAVAFTLLFAAIAAALILN